MVMTSSTIMLHFRNSCRHFPITSYRHPTPVKACLSSLSPSRRKGISKSSSNRCQIRTVSTRVGGGTGIPNEKEVEFLSYLENHSHNNNDGDRESEMVQTLQPLQGNSDRNFDTTTMAHEKHQKEQQQQLFNEAKVMTLSMYRTCIRCTKILNLANAYDEEQFLQREEAQKTKRLEFQPGDTMTFEPPVDRENELSSRSSYYLAFVKESCGQEMDCLTRNDPWREEDVERFVFMMNQGEERRKWILNDYQFDDPFHHIWESVMKTKLDSWEKNANSMIVDLYKRKGWKLKAEIFPELPEDDISTNEPLNFEDETWDDRNAH